MDKSTISFILQEMALGHIYTNTSNQQKGVRCEIFPTNPLMPKSERVEREF